MDKEVTEKEIVPVREALSWRSVLIGLAGAVFISALQVAYKVTPHRVLLPFHSALTLFPGVICLLFALALVNAGLRRWRSQAALDRPRPAGVSLHPAAAGDLPRSGLSGRGERAPVLGWLSGGGGSGVAGYRACALSRRAGAASGLRRDAPAGSGAATLERPGA